MGHEVFSAPTIHSERVAHAESAARVAQATRRVLDQVACARRHVDAAGHPDGTGEWADAWPAAETAALTRDGALAEGQCTWRLRMEAAVALVYAEAGPEHVKRALTALMALGVAWVEDIDTRDVP